MGAPRDGSLAQAGREEGAVQAGMPVAPVVQRQELSSRVARLELPRLRRIMVQTEQMW